MPSPALAARRGARGGGQLALNERGERAQLEDADAEDEPDEHVQKVADGVGLGVGLVIVWIALGFVKAILPLIVLGAVGYVAWRVLNKQ